MLSWVKTKLKNATQFSTKNIQIIIVEDPDLQVTRKCGALLNVRLGSFREKKYVGASDFE